MSYQILPNIIFIFAVLGIVLIILRRLPEASAAEHQKPEAADAGQKLIAKGLPAEAFTKVGRFLKLTVKKSWNFVLEAKDLKPHAQAGYQMKKIFGGALPGFKAKEVTPVTTQEIKNERYYLDLIKLQPRNLTHYDALGKFYLEKHNHEDAQDIYLYLTNHEPANPEFQARLGYCYYQAKNYDKAGESYRKSIGLDSTQPNRYYNLSLSLEAAGKHQEAQKAISKALELEPQNPKYQQALKKIKTLA